MDRGYGSRYHTEPHHGYSLYSFGNGYRAPSDDERDDRRKEYYRDDKRRHIKEEYRRDDRDPERYSERDGKRNDTYDKEDRSERYKRPKEDPYAPISQKDTMELNIELQLTMKALKKELYDKKEEVKHLQGLLQDERDVNSKLKREIHELKDEVDNRKQQIKSERAHRDTLFKENQYIIDKLEGENTKLRAMYPIIPPPMVPPMGLPPIHSGAPFPPRGVSSTDIPLQVFLFSLFYYLTIRLVIFLFFNFLIYLFSLFRKSNF